MADRYSESKIFRDKLPGPRRYETILYPEIPKRSTDRYVIAQEGDRFDMLSHKYYGSSEFWWVIADANQMGKGSFIIPNGKQIRIPFPMHDLYIRIRDTRKER